MVLHALLHRRGRGVGGSLEGVDGGGGPFQSTGVTDLDEWSDVLLCNRLKAADLGSSL